MAIEKSCDSCGSIFQGRGYSAKLQRFCSQRCKDTANKVDRICPGCGKAFWVYKSQLDGRGAAPYCSKQCVDEAKRKPKPPKRGREPIIKSCVICGVEFRVPPVRAGSAKTCSLECRGKLIARNYADKRVQLTCAKCSKPFSVPQCQASCRTYCSDECAEDSRKLQPRRGAQHYKWRGGQCSHHGGYLYVSAPGHPFGSRSTDYVFEHRIAIEQWMREEAPNHPFLTVIDGVPYLRPDIQVHHINEDKRDNRRANLVACTGAGHRDIHHGNAPMRGEVWPDIEGLQPYTPRKVLRHCETCGKEFFKKLCDVKRGGGRFCSRLCSDKRKRGPFQVTLK